jgi:hypothetical protein
MIYLSELPRMPRHLVEGILELSSQGLVARFSKFAPKLVNLLSLLHNQVPTDLSIA